MNSFPQDKGRDFVREHVYACQTGLVTELIDVSSGSVAFGREFDLSENAVNYGEPNGFEDWRVTDCIAWLRDNDVDEDEWPDDWVVWNGLTEEDREGYDYDIDMFSDDAQWRECVRDHLEEPEIHEWYVVSDWFEYQLEAIGEVILKNAYGSWWGRQCTGQAVYMDEYLRPIFEKWFGED